MNRLNLKKSKNALFLTLLVVFGIGLFSSVTLISCDDGGASKSSQSKNYNGTYYWSYDNGNTWGSHKITIRGNSWSGTTQFLSNVTYESGYLKGTSLINNDGNNVGYVSGNSIHYSNVMSHTLTKQ